MNVTSRIDQYLERYVHEDSRCAARLVAHNSQRVYERSLCVPLFDESINFIQALAKHPDIHSTLVILIINAPLGAQADALRRTRELLNLVTTESRLIAKKPHAALCEVTAAQSKLHMLVIDCCTSDRELPPKEGVGLARKLGNDIALELWRKKQITSPWLFQTDADAFLPNNYFHNAPNAKGAAAIHLNFEHIHPQGTSLAQRLYDLKLDYYVAGLAYSNSPYSHYSLGSAMIVHAEAYAAVRGYPKRSAGEDFYLLNKLAKVGPLVFDRTRTIKLTERLSQRVPFGTGPAVARLEELGEPLKASHYYAPGCFEALKLWQGLLHSNAETEAGNPHFNAQTAFDGLSGPAALKVALHRSLKQMNLLPWFEKTVRSNKGAQVKRQLNFGMDGLKTLQLIHALQDQGLHNVTAMQAQNWMNALPQKLLSEKTRLGGDGDGGVYTRLS